MNRTLPCILVSAALLLPLAALADPITCPLTLDEGAVSVVRQPRGWESVPTQGVRLSSGGLMGGHPANWAYLRGEDRKTRGGSTSVNRFASGEEKWLWCGYSGGAIQIAKRLPDAATECTVTHKATKLDGVTSIVAECR